MGRPSGQQESQPLTQAAPGSHSKRQRPPGGQPGLPRRLAEGSLECQVLRPQDSPSLSLSIRKQLLAGGAGQPHPARNDRGFKVPRVQGAAEEVEGSVPTFQMGKPQSREKGGAGAGLGALRVLSAAGGGAPPPPAPPSAGGTAASQTSEQVPPVAAAPGQGWKGN